MFGTILPTRPAQVHHAHPEPAATVDGLLELRSRAPQMVAIAQMEGPAHASIHEAWMGHWLLESSEDDKAEAALKAEGVPFLARKIAMKFRPERKFRVESDEVVGEVKTISGGWTTLHPNRETVSRTNGYTARAVTSWEGDGSVMVSVTTVTGPLGGHAGTTTTKHYIDRSRLVSETMCAQRNRIRHTVSLRSLRLNCGADDGGIPTVRSSAGGSYKTWFRKA